MKTLLKLGLIGALTTISRIIGQFLIPPGTQSVLEPSAFALQGTMPLAFTIYGVFAYSTIAALYLLIEKNLTGRRIIKGLKYGLSCCAIWILYLWEPLPHVHPLDRITYPLVDSAALLVMGLLLGWLLTSEETVARPVATKEASAHDRLFLASCFVIGRLLLYLALDIYSSFETQGVQTLVWTVSTGIVVASVVLWYKKYVNRETARKRALLSGWVLFAWICCSLISLCP